MTTAHRPKTSREWNARYEQGNLPWDNNVVDDRLPEVLAALGGPPPNALEVGCGTGTHAIWMAQQGIAVTAVDIAPLAVERAREKAKEAGVTCAFVAADFVAEGVAGGPFAFAFDRGCFHVFDDAAQRAAFVHRLAEALEPGAIWLSIIGSTDGPPRDGGPPRRSALDVVAAVEPRFEIAELRAVRFDQGIHKDARAWKLVARRRE